MSTIATRAEGRRAAAIHTAYLRFEDQAQEAWTNHGRRLDSHGRSWARLDSARRSTIIQAMSIADALRHSPRGSGPVHEAAHAVERGDSEAWLKNFIVPVDKFRADYAKAQKRGDSLDFDTWTASKTDAFSPTMGGASDWWSAHRIANNLEIPRQPIERLSIGVFSNFDVGARTVEQALIANVGRAEKMDPSVARGGALTRRITPLQTRLHWYAAEAISTQFLDLEYGFMGLQRDPVSEVNEALDLQADEIFYVGDPDGVSPFGVRNHPGMRQSGGYSVTSGSSPVEAVNVVTDAVRRLSSGSNRAAQTTLCQIGQNIWDILSRASVEFGSSGLAVLRANFPNVKFEESARLTNISTGVDGILCVDQRAGDEGLRSMESARILVTYTDGPETVVMGAQKLGGAYPATGIYAQLNLVSNS